MLTMLRVTMDEATLSAHVNLPNITSPIKSNIESIYLPTSITSQCRLATGRSALFHLIKRLEYPYAETVLLPSYVAEGVIQPFITAGSRVMFYQLESDLTPAVKDLELLLGEVKGKAVVVLIHYFGFSARSSELSAVLKQYQPLVVDDCAHALFTTTADGVPLVESAEIFLYSLNKFLPVTDGAILGSNRSDVDLNLEEEFLSELSMDALQEFQQHLKASLALYKCSDRENAKYYLKVIGERYQSYYDIINSDLSPFRQSMYSRQIEDTYAYDWLIKNRLLNSRIVYGELKSEVFTLVYPNLIPGVVPWCIPARVPANRRDEIINALFEENILLSTLQDKWDFIPHAQSDRFKIEINFMEEHVLIPISEFISVDSIRNMVKRLNQF
ncbi:DegT/DnrJ/EryC1/StrS family aminotransferase [Amylibacter sp.]|nr:DegT/DnrJ/EryC1/StrS family aminotransferase [Amylibacter sp.]